MPFWKKDSIKRQDSNDSGAAGMNGDGKPKEKVDYKARLQHKQYLVSNSDVIQSVQLVK